MIPKTIHYCWFGKNAKPKLAEKCIASWKKYCPDYKIIEWTEDNFPIDRYPYAKYCLEHGKWAFLSDFVRLVVVSEYGGIYMDTDVELLKCPDHLLENEAFYGFENKDYIATGLGFGAEQHHPTVEAMINIYLGFAPDENGDFTLQSCPALNTQALLSMGLEKDGKLQKVAGALILPVEYLNPYDDPTGRLNRTKNTVSVHWYAKSWLPASAILRSKLTKPFHRIFGTDCFRKRGK